jgi:hypothetical protein
MSTKSQQTELESEPLQLLHKQNQCWLKRINGAYKLTSTNWPLDNLYSAHIHTIKCSKYHSLLNAEGIEKQVHNVRHKGMSCSQSQTHTHTHAHTHTHTHTHSYPHIHTHTHNFPHIHRVNFIISGLACTLLEAHRGYFTKKYYDNLI